MHHLQIFWWSLSWRSIKLLYLASSKVMPLNTAQTIYGRIKDVCNRKMEIMFHEMNRTILEHQYLTINGLFISKTYLRLYMHFNHRVRTDFSQCIWRYLVLFIENAEGLSKPFKAKQIISVHTSKKIFITATFFWIFENHFHIRFSAS